MEEEPMPPLCFAGAILTGLGVILLLHGGAPALLQKAADAVRLTAVSGQQWAHLPRAGGLLMAAGLALAGFGIRRRV